MRFSNSLILSDVTIYLLRICIFVKYFIKYNWGNSKGYLKW